MTVDLRLDLTSLDTYRRSCLEIAAGRLKGFTSLDELRDSLADLNAYPKLDGLTEPRDVRILDEEELETDHLDQARQAVLDGRVFWEHTAAGEATRLKMGAKFLISPVENLTPEDIAFSLSIETGREVSVEEVNKKLKAPPESLIHLNLGLRHLLQLAFELHRLAEKSGADPDRVLARQNMLLILNEKTAPLILEQIRSYGFLGFSRDRFLFMIQPAFPGINVSQGQFFFDPQSPRRLHNHGQLAMQETMDQQMFRLDESGGRVYLHSSEFADILDKSLDKISYNIEDLGYLTGALDFPSLALALRLGQEGFRMVMEIVANDPESPIKGGLAAYDPALGRNVMVESFQLKGVSNEEIKFLNKNFNHYTIPADSWRAVKENGLPMPMAVKRGFLYFQPVQGDINFLVNTAFVKRRILKPIHAWKSAANTIAAVNAMWEQDGQAGFKEFCLKITG